MLAFTAVGAHCYNKVIKEMLQIGNAILFWRASATELKILGVEQNPKGSTVSMYNFSFNIIPRRCLSSECIGILRKALPMSTFAKRLTLEARDAMEQMSRIYISIGKFG